MVLKSAAKLKHLAPDAVCVADPLAFTGCGRMCAELEPETARKLVARAMTRGDRPVHPVTLWRRRLSVAIDALETKPAPPIEAPASPTSGAARWRPPTSNCPPVTGC